MQNSQSQYRVSTRRRHRDSDVVVLVFYKVITWHYMHNMCYYICKYILSPHLHNDADLDAGGVHQGGVQELGGAARLVLSPTLCCPGVRTVLQKGSE